MFDWSNVKTNEPFYINSLEKTRENGLCWKTPNYGLYYYCIIEKNYDNFINILINKKKIKCLTDKIIMIYYQIIKIGRNIIFLDVPCRANFYFNDKEKTYSMNSQRYSPVYNRQLEELIDRYFQKYSIPNIKNLGLFIFELETKGKLYLKKQDFLFSDEVLFAELDIFSEINLDYASNIIKNFFRKKYNKKIIKKLNIFNKIQNLNKDILNKINLLCLIYNYYFQPQYINILGLEVENF